MLLVLLTSVSPPLVAQDDGPPRRAGVPSLTPYAGLHHAFGTLLTDRDPEGGWRVHPGLVLGARLEVPVAARAAVQVDVGYATPPIHGFGVGYPDFEADGRFVSYTARLSMALTPQPRLGLPRAGAGAGRTGPAVGITAHAGAGVMQHWVASPQARYSTWPALVAGSTLRFAVGRLPLFLTGELYLYQARFSGETETRALQQDLRITLGAWLSAG